MYFFGVVVERQRAAVLDHIGFLALRLRRLWQCKQGDEQRGYHRSHVLEYISFHFLVCPPMTPLSCFGERLIGGWGVRVINLVYII